MGRKLILAVLSMLLLVGWDAYAAMPVNPSYVSPEGSGTSCTNVSPCALSYANANADAGDIIYLRGGNYSTAIYPSRSGTSGNLITYTNYSDELPVITNPAPIIVNRNYGIWIQGKSYIKINGIKIDGDSFTSTGPNNLLLINSGASRIEISRCIFSGKAYLQTYQSTHLWIHDNVFTNNSTVTVGCDDTPFGLQLGAPAYAGVDGYSTLEDNVFEYGGHHNLETFTFKNVIRNNYFHNEGNAPGSGCTYGPDSNGLYGNRNIQIYDGTNAAGTFNLVDGNRFGFSGPPPDDDGGDGFTLTAPKNIVRYNAIYNSQNNGFLLKIGASSYSNNNRIYNNTIYKSGRFQNTGQWQGYGIRVYPSVTWATGNVIKNNLLYGNESGDFVHSGTSETDNTIVNNWLEANGNPLFIDETMSDPQNASLPNLNLQSGSPAINGGTYLTQANGSGSSSTTLIVDDALYFQDGTWGSSLAGHQADWIAVGTVANTVQISSIDYDTNTITLATAITWSDNDPVWLYKKSDGVQVLYGAGPDYGAYEYTGSDPVSTSTQTGVVFTGVSLQ